MRASIFELQGAVVAKEREIEDLKTEQARSHENYKRQLMEQVPLAFQCVRSVCVQWEPESVGICCNAGFLEEGWRAVARASPPPL